MPAASGSEPGSRGRFFVLDGVDGCGKTTQAGRLAAALGSATGSPVHHLREPGSTSLGEGVRELLLGRGSSIGAEVEVLLFAAARRQMLDERVAPALAAGEHVVCERFHPSTYAYQAVGGGLDPDRVLGLLREWAGAPAPDLVVLLDLDVDEAERRRGTPGDRIEEKGRAFQERVADGYRRYVREAPDSSRVAVVEASGAETEVAERVWLEVHRVLD